MFEMLLNRVSDLPSNLGPGPKSLIGGDKNAGFFGEVPYNQFKNGVELASAINLTAGIVQNTNEPWLKFILDGKILYVAKKTFRHTLSWDQINAVGAVVGTKQISFGGNTYKVRLLKATVTDFQYNNSFDPPETHGSEWNRLMYRVSGRPWYNAENTLASENIEEGDWAQYTEAQLNFVWQLADGGVTMCQERVGSDNIRRGSGGVSHVWYNPSNTAARTHGWRPVLELVP